MLAGALNSIANQTIEANKWEVLVVDNGSTDDTKTVADQFKTLIKQLRYFYVDVPGLHIGRHVGYQEAKGQILVYVDDDIEALPTWLESISSSFEDPETFLVGGKCLPKYEVDPPNWICDMWSPNDVGERILGYLSLIDLGEDLKPISPYYVFGCNFSIRRSVLLEAKGFHPDGMPQDLIYFRGDGESYISRFIQEKNYKAIYHPLASVYHCVPSSRMTLDYFCLRAHNQGISDSYTTIRRQGSLAPPVVQPVKPPETQLQKLYRCAKSPLHHGLNWTRRLLTKPVPPTPMPEEDPEITKIRQAISAAYRSGYAFHQDAVRDIPGLLDWVLQEDYWDYRLPDFSKNIVAQQP